MLLVFSAELKSQGIEHKTATSFFFQGNLFERGVAFSNRLYGLAIETCRKELAAGGFCLLVDNHTHLTIWHQKLSPIRSETAYLDTSRVSSTCHSLAGGHRRPPNQTIEQDASSIPIGVSVPLS